MTFLVGWDASLATNHSILVLIPITIREFQIQEYLTEFFPLRDMASCQNFDNIYSPPSGREKKRKKL